jgi:hypothetical protein
MVRLQTVVDLGKPMSQCEFDREGFKLFIIQESTNAFALLDG